MKKMRKLILSLFIAATTILGLGIAFGVDSQIPTNRVELIDHINRIVRSSCVVYVGFAHQVPGYKCGGDEVMTGYRDNMVYCSTLAVDCFSEQRLSQGEK